MGLHVPPLYGALYWHTFPVRPPALRCLVAGSHACVSAWGDGDEMIVRLLRMRVEAPGRAQCSAYLLTDPRPRSPALWLVAYYMVACVAARSLRGEGGS